MRRSPGDELRLAPEATFSGNFVLPVTTGSSTITVRTDLPDAALPPARAARHAGNGRALRADRLARTRPPRCARRPARITGG